MLCVKVLHAISMHRSLTQDLKNTDRSQPGISQDIAGMGPGQRWLSQEQLGPALNPLYEYKLPRGPGLAVRGTTAGTEHTSDNVHHTTRQSAAGTGGEDTLSPPLDIFFARHHNAQGFEMQTCSGVQLLLSDMNGCLYSGWYPFR